MISLHDVMSHLRAGRWNDAHNLVQTDDSPVGAWLHGILHIQEGDLEDAEYWYGRAGRNFRRRGTLQEELQRLETELPSAMSLRSTAGDRPPVSRRVADSPRRRSSSTP